MKKLDKEIKASGYLQKEAHSIEDLDLLDGFQRTFGDVADEEEDENEMEEEDENEMEGDEDLDEIQ